MTRLLKLALLLALVLTSLTPATGAAAQGSNPRALPALRDHYIVTLKAGERPGGLLSAHGIRASFVYDKVLNGFAAHLTLGQLAALQRSGAVERIEADRPVTLAQPGVAAVPSWGLDRINQNYLPLNGNGSFAHTASNVNAYIIDTGIQTNLAEFGGRAAVAYDALGGNGQDCQGSGTFNAGIVGGSTFGVAKGVRLWAVRVLNCQGSGSIAQVVAGLNWVAANHRPNAVALVSVGGSFSAAMNTAVKNMINSGVATAAVAGSSGGDACNFSPSSVTEAIVAAASNSSDQRAPFNNTGTCIDLYAPGVSITSITPTGPQARSGTTMAAAHVAGVAALYKAVYGDQPSATVHNWIINVATPNVIINNVLPTPNRLLYSAGL
ncbi:MAG TPA: S8 family peptidase [Roseiflexaceae bacterium]|nr:S8 family peptidase [Roseiflexaceae bacterium]